GGRRHGRGRPNCLRRAHCPACGAAHHRSQPSLGPALFHAPVRDPDGRGRYPGAHRGTAGGGRGGYHGGTDRRTVLHRARQTAPDQPAMTTAKTSARLSAKRWVVRNDAMSLVVKPRVIAVTLIIS